MTSLIDTIEDAFRSAVLDAEPDGAVTCTAVVHAIEQHLAVGDDCHGSLEGIVDDAYLAAAHAWGSDWRWQTGDVAERVCDGLRDWVKGGC